MVPVLLAFYSGLKGLPSEYAIPAGHVARITSISGFNPQDDINFINIATTNTLRRMLAGSQSTPC